MLGAVLGGYRLEQLVATGGTGRVFLARHTELPELVAIKVPAENDPEHAKVLTREAGFLAELAGRSPGIVTWKCHDVCSELPWLAMEWIEGPSLAHFVKRTHAEATVAGRAPASIGLLGLLDPSPLERALSIFELMARGVATLHEHGIVHADLTPSNVLLRSDDRPVIIDLGSAFRDASAFQSRDSLRRELHAYGTRGYVAPEVDLGSPGDIRRDLFGLGCILWNILSGASPRRDIAVDVERRLPEGPLRNLLLELVRADPESRLASAHEVAEKVASLRDSAVPSSAAGRRSPVPRARFVGRDHLVHQLKRRIEAARGGGGSASLVLGEAGIGKSRLCNEAIAIAQRDGFHVVSAACADMRSPVAGPERAAILDALAMAEPFRAAPGDGATTSPQFERAQLLHSLFETLSNIATKERPLLVVLDDLHWADDVTWAFMRSERLASVANLPLCILASYRINEPNAAALDELDKNVWSRIDLGSLNVDDVRAIAQTLLGSAPLPGGFDRWLHEMTSGNPLHVTECVREFLAKRESLGSAGNHESLTETFADFARSSRHWVPSSLTDVMDMRVGGVSSGARLCARIAAMLGDGFTRDELEGPVHAVDPAIDIDAALNELRRQCVLESVEPRRFRFSHNLYAVASMQPVPDLDEMHLARLLTQYYEPRESRKRTSAESARLAMLLAQSRVHDRAFEYFVDAARSERAANQITRARRLYDHAVEQFGAMANQRAEHAAVASAVHVELADLLSREARHEEADSHYERAMLLAAQQLDGVARAGLLRKRARALRARNRHAASIRLLNEACEALGTYKGDSAFWGEWIEIEVARFWLTYYAREPFGDVLLRLEPIVVEHGTNLQQSDFYQCAATSLLAANRYRGSETACAYAERALAAIRGSPELRDRLPDACMVAAFPLLWCGRTEWQNAIVLLEEAESGALWMDDLTLLAQARTYLALAHRRCGNTERAAAVARSAHVSAERADSRGYRGASLATLAWVAWKSGDLQQTERLAREARAAWRDGALRHPFQCFLNLVWADALRTSERFDEARARLAELLAKDFLALPPPLEEAILRAAGDGGASNQDARIEDKLLLLVTRTAMQTGFL